MTTKKSEVNTYTVTGTINNLQVGVEIGAKDLSEAMVKAEQLKFSDFVATDGDVHDFDGPEITAIWKK